MSDMNISNPSSLSTRRGQLIIFAIIGLFFILQFFTVYIGRPNYLRIVLYSWLFVLLYHGHKWARILLGVLFALGTVLGIVFTVGYGFAESSSAAPTAQGTILMVGTLLSAAALLSSFLLLTSKDVIAFLEQNQQYFAHEPSRQLEKEILELQTKLQIVSEGQLPNYAIKTVLAVPGTNDRVILLDYSNPFRNIIRCTNDGALIWQAELPTAKGDVYSNLAWKDGQLTAFSRSCFSVVLDFETGKIISPDLQQRRVAA